MDAEQVVQKILSEARSEADKIKAEANEEAAAQQDQLASELAEFQKETYQKTQVASEDKIERMLASARMEAKKNLLFAKVSLLDEVFQKAREQIKKLPKEVYQELIVSLMKKAVESGDEEVLISADENRIDNELVKKVNAKLGPDIKGNLKLAKDPADIDGGFILRRGNIQVNVSLEVLISQAKQNLETELSQELFG
jgi:V/A-type H+/Na+-transporting ATPase subunit E